MNVKKMVAMVFYLLSVAQTSKSAVPRVSQPAGRNFAKPTWKSAIRQSWKPALRTLKWADSALTKSKLVKAGHTKSKLVKPGQTKMKKYFMFVCFRDFRACTSLIRLQSDLTGFQSRLAPTLIQARSEFDPTSIRPYSGLIRQKPKP